MSNSFQILEVTPENVSELGFYCVRNSKSAGHKAKLTWFLRNYEKGLKIKIAADGSGKQLGFIEYIPAEHAWRPVVAPGWFFIHCIAVLSKENRKKTLGSELLHSCLDDALNSGKQGVCTMTSKGPWVANNSLFIQNGFVVSEELDRFELMSKSLTNSDSKPQFINWLDKQKKLKGWHLIYSDQCPWHEKSVTVLSDEAKIQGINLNVTRLANAKEAQHAPSGFGTFSLIKDGQLLADHYISRTRFLNILKTV